MATDATLTEQGLSSRGAELVEAAAKLFYERGFTETTTREITNACGLTPGALYNHFSSKEELLWVIVEGAYHHAEQISLDAVKRGDGDPVAELRELAYATTRMHTSDYKIKAIVARLERKRLPKDQAAQIEEVHEKVPRIWAKTLRRGVKSKAFDLPEVDGKQPNLVALSRTMVGYCTYSGFWFGPSQSITSEQLSHLQAEMVVRMATGTAGA
ncbi:MAG: TetR/AcrR family transcriptional regulator [Actinobacteria bacterium]|nr:TetR/AcrR family transcriptional regulator [Actinomycetota bacterium]